MAKSKLSNRVKSINNALEEIIKKVENNKNYCDDKDLCEVYVAGIAKKASRLKTAIGKRK